MIDSGKLKEKYSPEGSELMIYQHKMVEEVLFIDKVCNKIASIDHGHIEIFEGTYSEHEAYLAQHC